MTSLIKYKKFIVYALIPLLFLLDIQSKNWAVSFFSYICDDYQFCSYNILPIFSLTYVCNYGITFGMFNQLENGDVILSIIAILACIAFLFCMLRSQSIYEKVCYGFIISGACGNIYDRIIQSCVTDFLHFHYLDFSFPVFNVADCFVSIGGVMIVIFELRKWFINRKKI